MTAQFASAGFSLQMAHTLTYCVPLDGILTLYDPETLAIFSAERRRKKSDDSYDNDLLDVLTKRKQPQVWPIPGEYDGSQTLIVDGRYLLSDAYGDDPTLVAEIDRERQRVIPYSNPTRKTFYDEAFERQSVTDIAQIDPSSLLIDRKYLSVKAQRALWENDPPPFSQPIYEILCKSLLSINLALGFVLCVRALRGLPTAYQPREFKRGEA